MVKIGIRGSALVYELAGFPYPVDIIHAPGRITLTFTNCEVQFDSAYLHQKGLNLLKSTCPSLSPPNQGYSIHKH